MPSTAWLADRRTEVAAERILDAAGELFAGRDPGSVGMLEIARTAGCSRATLYRYFDSRDSLYTAYVHREAQRVYRQMTANLAGIRDPRRRLIEGMTQAIALVRQSPAMASWFAETGPPIGGQLAERSEVITSLVTAFVTSLGAQEPPVIERRARWVVRVLTSLLTFPGRDAADERTMLEEFVAPLVTPGRAVPAQTAPAQTTPA